jgi:uncharacterized protein YfaS (alpha-2-macroglobulin family)
MIVVGSWLVPGIVRAAPNVPELAQRADGYRKSIEALKVAPTAVQLLRAIKKADIDGRKSELLQLCEQLVALNSGSFASWLQLANAHRANERRSDKALAAGYEAYTVARLPSEQVEALLLMSSVLRAQLKQQSEAYSSTREDIEAINRKLRLLDDAEKSGDIPQLDRNSPAGEWKILSDAKDSSSVAAEQTSKQIQELTAELDAIYAEVATKLPLNLTKVKSDDARSSAFDVIPNSDSPPSQVTYRTRDNKVLACFDFTQRLKPNNASYHDAVAVWNKAAQGDDNSKVAVLDFGTEVNDRSLCITNLKPGDAYKIKLTSKLESAQGATLRNEITLDVNTRDLPEQVAFSGRSFLLPQSGDGEVPLRITNVPQFGLEIYRITDRTLHRHVALGHIGGSLPKQEYEDLRDRFAERLWSGTIRISDDEKKRNRSFRAFLPVRAILNARKTDIEEKIKSSGIHQGPIAFWPQQNQTLGNDDGREVAIQDARFEADIAAFEAASAKRPSPGVYALVVRDLNEKPDQDNSPKCSEECGGYLVQWFVDTDIGLSFYEGDNDFTVVARSLQTGEAKRDTRIELVSSGNRVLESSRTDQNGVAKFARSITQGTQSNKLVAILAETNSDSSFLTFGSERLDLSRLNVDGRSLTNGLISFVTTDRGVYQGGDVIHTFAMIRDTDGKVPSALPKIVVRLEARDRTLDVKRVAPDQLKSGGMDIALNVPTAARSGVARITVSSGDAENAPVIGDVIVQLGQIRPDRARLDFAADSSWTVRKSAPDMVDLIGAAKARYLFGDGYQIGAASNLKAEVVVKVKVDENLQRSCYRGFSFGLFDDKSTTVSTRQFFQTTDQNGDLKLELSRIPIPVGTKPVSATIEITLFDSSGPLAARSMTIPLLDDQGWIGISKIPQLRSTDDGRWKLGADLLLATSTPTDDQDRTLGFRLQRESELYLWEQRDGTWQHVKSVQREDVRVFDRIVHLDSGGGAACSGLTNLADLADDLESGRYVLTVSDQKYKRQSSIRFQTGSSLTDPEDLEPNTFALSAGRSVFRPGDTIELTASVPFDGPVLVALADTDIRNWFVGTASNHVAKVRITADPNWSGKQLYALATAYRSATDRKIGPSRAIGITSFSVEGNKLIYAASIRPSGNAEFDTVKPGAQLSFDICISDEPGGKCSEHPPEEAFAVAYVVDEGLLGLTSHHNSQPTPETFFFGRKKLSIRLMDNYDRLLLKTPGDRPTRLALSNYTSTKIFAADCGIDRGDHGEPMKLQHGSATCTIPKIDLPVGAVSIYAVVWSADYAVAATKTLSVRSHVVADLGTPNFLLAGDNVTLPLRLENIDLGYQGDFLVRVTSKGAAKGLSFVSGGNVQQIGPAQTQLRLQLARGQPKTAYLSLETAPEASGDIGLQVSVEPADTTSVLDDKPRDWTIGVRAPTLSSVETLSFPLQKQPVNLAEKLKSAAAKYDPNTVKVTARFSDSPRLLLSAAWSSVLQGSTLPVLDQLIWRGMLLLNSRKIADNRAELARLVNEIQSLQLPNGSFLPYRTIGNPSEAEQNLSNSDPQDPGARRDATVLRTASVLDLLSMLGGAGIDVSAKTISTASHFLKNAIDISSSTGNRDCTFDDAYAIRVMVGFGIANRFNLDALSGCEQADADTETMPAKAASAAAFQQFGMSEEAKLTLASFGSERNPDKFKDLSDFRKAMMLAFLMEAKAPSDLVQTVAQSLLAASTRTNLSAAAAAWVARTNGEGSNSGPPITSSDLVLNGLTARALHQNASGLIETDAFPLGSLQTAPILVGSNANRPVQGYVTIEGILTKPDETKRVPDGALKRRFFDSTTGQEIDLSKTSIEAGARIVVVLEGKKAAIPSVLNADGEPVSDDGGPLLLADLLPSAFEIVSNNFPLTGKTTGASNPLEALAPAGDLRTVFTDTGRWIGLVVPESQRPKQEADLPSDSADQTSKGGTKASSLGSDDAVEFRRAYVARVNLAGRFTLPAISIERSLPPNKNFLSRSSVLQVKVPQGALK